MKALTDQLIVLYESPEMVAERNGLLQLSNEARRNLQRGKTRIITAGEPPPDIIRHGLVVASGYQGINEGDTILYNKHDADEFEEDRKTYYRIHGSKALAKVMHTSTN